MSDFRPGDVVDITIRGARVESVDNVGIAVCSLPDSSWLPTVDLCARGVTVVRCAPPEWPVQVGDLWRDGEGVLWLAGQGWLRSTEGRSCPLASFLTEDGPVELVHRESTQDGAR